MAGSYGRERHLCEKTGKAAALVEFAVGWGKRGNGSKRQVTLCCIKYMTGVC